jgi:hypothetical protein
MLDVGALLEPQAFVPVAPPISSECRPIAEPWVEGTPLRLPCVRTDEPCDGVDNDADGITDPHCPTRTCQADGDCTFGGLIPDVDCDSYSKPPSCKPIDGAPRTDKHEDCWGALCPPGIKCVEGECVPPGTGLPDAACESGGDCPLQAGCFSKSSDGSDPRCAWLCQDFSCPVGYLCSTDQNDGNSSVEHETCKRDFVCSAALSACSGVLAECLGDVNCRSVLRCLAERCPEFLEDGSDVDCRGECLAGAPFIGAVVACALGVCGG